jgi:transposase-like protein
MTMPRGVPHSDETRAAALAALLTGQSVHEVAAAYHLDRKTVREWEAAYKRHRGEAVPPQKGTDLGGRIAAYLDAALDTLRAQARFSADESWLRQQSASEIAVLHGVLADKAFRIIEAIEDTQDAEPRPMASDD